MTTPGGRALQTAWTEIALAPDVATVLQRLRHLQRGLLSGGANISALLHDGRALFVSAHPTGGARLLRGGQPHAPEPSVHSAHRPLCLKAGPHLPGLKRRRLLGDIVIAEDANQRPMALAMFVPDLHGAPNSESQIAPHMSWIRRQGVPLLGLTDGTEWRWLERSEGTRFGASEVHPVQVLARYG